MVSCFIHANKIRSWHKNLGVPITVDCIQFHDLTYVPTVRHNVTKTVYVLTEDISVYHCLVYTLNKTENISFYT